MNSEMRSLIRKDGLAALLCGVAAVLIAIAPHLAADGPYLAGGDDVIYLAIARPAYHGEGKLRDPYAAASANLPTAFSWTQFVPFTAPLKWLGIPFLRTIFAWQVLGAFFTGSLLYVLLRLMLKNPIAALAVTAVWLGDAGTIGGRPVLDSILLAPKFREHAVSTPMATAYNQYRVVSPLLCYPFLFLVLIGFAARSRSVMRSIAVGVALGVIVLMYFFFWTAIVGTLGMYLLFHLVRYLRTKEPSSKVEVRFTLTVLAVGLLVGGGQIVSNSLTFADPAYRAALDRTSLGYHVPKGDPIRTQYLRSVWPFAEIAVGLVAFAITRSRLLGLFILLTFSGYLLKNSAVVTGLEFENYHWNFVQKSFGSLTVLASLLLLAPRAKQAILLLGLVLLPFAFAWRIHESQRAVETVRAVTLLRELAPLSEALTSLSTETMLAGPDAANVAILYGRSGQLYQHPHVSHRSLIPDVQVHERHALNGWLQGFNEDEYSLTAQDLHFSMTASSREEWQLHAVLKARLAIFRQLQATNGGEVLAKYEPLALLLPAGKTPSRGGTWEKLAESPDWTLWKLAGRQP